MLIGNRKTILAGLFASSSVALWACFLAVALAASPAASRKAPNPHWKKDACASCHTVDNGKKLPIPEKSIDETCLNCHDGEKASYEFHPVGKTFDAAKYQRPEKWPLVNDRLSCRTCHEMRLACSETVDRPGANRMMLRDYRLTPGDTKPFCRNCHKESAYRKLNPHEMVLAEKNEIIEDKCLFCHEKPMDRKAKERTGKALLRTDQLSMCRDCHPQHRDPMQQGHINAKISPDMQALMQAREITGLNSNLNAQSLAQIKAAGGRPRLMVGGADDRIVCSTCHNPHQNGVFPLDSVLAYRAMRPGGQGHLVSPVRGQKWCRHCHDF